MKAKEVARLLEFIKYFTLNKKEITITTNNDVDKLERIEDTHIELSGRILNIESIIYDFGAEYSSSLENKEMNVYFGKCPKIGTIIGTGPDRKYEITTNPDGLMTPAIIQPYIKDGESFKRYIFPSNQDNTYSQEFTTYNDWYRTVSFVDIDQNYSRNRSITILVEQSSIPGFESFMNESLSDWRSRFILDKFDAIEGNFDRFSLYDPKIYDYELPIEDRKIILDKLVTTTNWTWTFDLLSDKFELFISLINIASEADGAELYNYMFAPDTSTGKTNLQVYKDKLPTKLYDELIRVLMSYFYFTYSTKEDGIKELLDGFRKDKFYPIGFLEKGVWEMGLYTYYDLDEEKEKGTGPFRLGVKYNIEITSNFLINIKSAERYKYNYLPYLNRIEYDKYKIKENSPNPTVFNYNDVIYISPFLANQEFIGLNIPYGSIIPIPAFALNWLIDQNEDTQSIIDLIEKGATIAGVIFPILKIYQAAFLIEIVYESIGLGFTLTSNTLGVGLQDQIKKYDESKSTPSNPYRNGQEFLSYYYLLSSIYGLNGIKDAISDAKNINDKIKVLSQFETILSAKGIRDDFKSFMTLQYPNDNLDAFNTMSNDINDIEKEFNKYRYLRN